MCFRAKVMGVIALVGISAVGCDTSSLLDAPGTFVGGTNNNTGGTVLTVSASSSTVTTNTPVSITASATANGTPVANDTQVTFATNFGSFTDSSSPNTVQRTTNGLAAANITSRTAGIATVTATVGSVSKTVTVTFTSPPS